MNDPFAFWEESLPPHERLAVAGDDLGEKFRDVKGEALTEDDADLFAALLGIE